MTDLQQYRCGQNLEKFIFYWTALKYVQEVQKPGSLKALFMTVYLCVKKVSKPEVVQIYAF